MACTSHATINVRVSFDLYDGGNASAWGMTLTDDLTVNGEPMSMKTGQRVLANLMSPENVGITWTSIAIAP